MTDLSILNPRDVPPAADRVATGVGWLNRTEPGWRQRIDLATFDITDCALCVLGQVFGSYWYAGPNAMTGDSGFTSEAYDAYDKARDWSRAHGFLPYLTEPDDNNWYDDDLLTAAWADEIRRTVES